MINDSDIPERDRDAQRQRSGCGCGSIFLLTLVLTGISLGVGFWNSVQEERASQAEQMEQEYRQAVRQATQSVAVEHQTEVIEEMLAPARRIAEARRAGQTPDSSDVAEALATLTSLQAIIGDFPDDVRGIIQTEINRLRSEIATATPSGRQPVMMEKQRP